MSNEQLLGLLGQGGVVAVLLFILGRVIWKVGERMLGAIDRVVAKLDEHTKTDVEHHTDVREAVVRVEAKIDAWNESTPVEQPRRATPAPGYYGPRRPPTSGNDR